jgi:hypothetical protein
MLDKKSCQDFPIMLSQKTIIIVQMMQKLR